MLNALLAQAGSGFSWEGLGLAVLSSAVFGLMGIGAGAGCDGQILVLHDLLGMLPGRTPRHVRAYADLKTVIADAATRYRDDVRNGTFPGPEQSFQ